ncbi:MAG TPA: transglutaminase domain-containing protein [Candidatus Levybacteria bacterium]|nr:transglutaminase domain-containing protein [Candidatus Levybacteria bacterium]
MIIKIIKIFLVLFLLIFYPVSHGFAQEKEDSKDYFTVTASSLYQVVSSSATHVIQEISIVNKKEFFYAPSYAITLHTKSISNIAARNDAGAIPFTLKEGEGGSKTIEITFPEKIVGVGKTNSFTFSYDSSDFTHKIGNILTIQIPALSGSQTFDSYTAAVNVPSEFGTPSIIKPNVSYDKKGNTYIFSNGQLTKGIEMIFGEFQLYRFKLSYHLENNNVFPVTTELALPPNTSYQEVVVESVTPKPKKVYRDIDKNTLATYLLPPKTTTHVVAEVLVKVRNSPTQEILSESQRKIYVKPQKYWEVEDAEIQKIAKELKTPSAIYDYVVKTLSYETKKANLENVRQGAKKALANPLYAVCLEFTDLFISLARAADIPARSVEGYAYTDDSQDKPLSLFEDVLHAWPEYYDDNKKAWIMVDPTWGNTTGGVDYFNSLDFDHVAFVINGEKSSYPVPAGGYKTEDDTKDITVSYPDSVVFIKNPKTQVSGSFSSFTNNGVIDGKIKLINLGNSESKSQKAEIYLDQKRALAITFPEVPPYGETELSVSIPQQNIGILSSLTKFNHTITIHDESGQELFATKIKTFPFSQYYLIGGAIFIGIIFILILAFKTRSLSVQK